MKRVRPLYIPPLRSERPESGSLILRDGTTAAATRMQKLNASSGLRLQRKQQLAVDTDVLQLDRARGPEEMRAVLERMAADPNVEFAVADERRWIHAVPGDPLQDVTVLKKVHYVMVRGEEVVR